MLNNDTYNRLGIKYGSMIINMQAWKNMVLKQTNIILHTYYKTHSQRGIVICKMQNTFSERNNEKDKQKIK